MITVRRILIVTLALAGVAWMLPDPKSVAFIRPPAFVSVDDVHTFQIRVEPKPDHRRLTVGAWDTETDPPLEVSHSEEPLDGANAPRTRWMRLRLPRGRLQLRATVYGMQGVLAVATTPVWVLGRFDERPTPEDLVSEPE